MKILTIKTFSTDYYDSDSDWCETSYKNNVKYFQEVTPQELYELRINIDNFNRHSNKLKLDRVFTLSVVIIPEKIELDELFQKTNDYIAELEIKQVIAKELKDKKRIELEVKAAEKTQGEKRKQYEMLKKELGES